jgi:DNA-3-methyladenine glycosylase
VFDRSILLAPSVEVAPLLLGAILSRGSVSLRITEVEAYQGSLDPGSHAFRGQNKRNSVMFGEPGHLYTYFTYGMHTCANIVCAPVGTASGVLLRAGEIVAGIEEARERRTTSKSDSDLARGPARLTRALGITLADGGTDLESGSIRLDLMEQPQAYASGPRTGLSGPGGGDDFPWRFWLPGEPSVSPYKKHSPKRRQPA